MTALDHNSLTNKLACGRVIVVLLWALVAITALVEVYVTHGYTAVSAIGMLNLCAWLCVLVWIAVIHPSWRALAIIGTVLLPLCAVELYLLSQHRAVINGHTLAILFGTDASESLSTLWDSLAYGVLALLMLLAGLWASWTCSSAYLLGQALRRQFFKQAIGATVGMFGLVWLVSPTIPAEVDVSSAELRTFEAVFPWGVPARVLSFVRERARKQDWIARSHDFRFSAKAVDAAPRVVVLVIGESAAAGHWQLGGYGRDTNPLLAKRTDVIWLQNYAAPAVATAASVPMMLTRKPVHRGHDAIWPERSIVSAYREAGYETHWISNQLTAGMHDLMISTFAQEAQLVRWLSLGAYQHASALDEHLLPALDDALESGAKKQFIVLHTMGSHFRYADRLPPHARHFSSKQNTELDTYDDTVRYTDSLLNQIIERLAHDARPSLMLYVSDHGEIMPSATCKHLRHGYGVPGDVMSAGLVWLSAHASHAGKRAAIERAASLPLSGTQVFQSLITAGDLRFQGAQRAQSWFEPEFSPAKRQVSLFGRVLDADGEPPKPCESYPDVPHSH